MSWITLTTPSGVVLDLDDRINITIEGDGAKGLSMPTFEFGIEALTVNLSRYQQVKTGKRIVELPLLVQASSALALETEISNINKLLNPLDGDSILTITRADGTQRKLTCRYLEGNEGDYGNGQYGLVWIKFILSLQAIDPIFYDVIPVADNFAGTNLATFFPVGRNFFPMSLSGSTVVGAATVQNPGSVDAWPIWTIIGPGDNLILRNITTEKKLSLPVSLLPSDKVTIDTRPDKKTVLLNDSVNYFPKLALNYSALWPFVKGRNDIQLEMTNIISGVSSISYTFNPPYLDA